MGDKADVSRTEHRFVPVNPPASKKPKAAVAQLAWAMSHLREISLWIAVQVSILHHTYPIHWNTFCSFSIRDHNIKKVLVKNKRNCRIVTLFNSLLANS